MTNRRAARPDPATMWPRRVAAAVGDPRSRGTRQSSCGKLGNDSGAYLRTIVLSAAVAFVLAVVFVEPAGFAQGTAAPSGAVAGSSPDAALIKTYCATCHNDRTSSGELSLEHADLTDIPKHAELWEKVIRKVRAGMMPPAGMPRPDAATLEAFVSSSRNVHRSRRGGQSTSRPHGASSTQSRRVRERDPRPARARDRRHGAPAAGR